MLETSTVVPILAAIALISLLHTIIKWRSKTRQNAPLPPGPSPWPIMGCVPAMWSNKPAYKWVHKVMDDLNTDIACIRLGKIHVVPVRSPELAREFLKKHDAAFASRPETVTTQMMSQGYLTTAVVPSGKQWKKMRRVIVSSVFSSSNMRWLLHRRNLEADNLVRFIYNHCSATNSKGTGKVVNIRAVGQHYSANIMKRLIFNRRHFGEPTSNGGPSFEDEQHVDAIFALLLYNYAFNLSDYLPFLKCFDIDGHSQKARDAVEIIRKSQDPIVNDRIRKWGDGAPTNNDDLLDVFISLTDSKGDPLLTDKEIKAQLLEVFTAGIDNPPNTVEWALSEMLNQPEIMEKAVDELDRVVGREKLLQEADIPNLPYLTACAREAMRLHPVAPFNLPHTSTVDCTVAGYFIPKGSSVLLSRLGLGRNPKVWDDPLRFDPCRHLSNGVVDLREEDLRFITFTTGRRGCPGFDLGSKITMMLLGRILQGFTLTIPDGSDAIDLSEAVSLFKAEPLYVQAKPRLHPSLYLALV